MKRRKRPGALHRSRDAGTPQTLALRQIEHLGRTRERDVLERVHPVHVAGRRREPAREKYRGMGILRELALHDRAREQRLALHSERARSSDNHATHSFTPRMQAQAPSKKHQAPSIKHQAQVSRPPRRPIEARTGMLEFKKLLNRQAACAHIEVLEFWRVEFGELVSTPNARRLGDSCQRTTKNRTAALC